MKDEISAERFARCAEEVVWRVVRESLIGEAQRDVGHPSGPDSDRVIVVKKLGDRGGLR